MTATLVAGERMRTTAELSDDALRLLAVLHERRATAPERAVTDAVLAADCGLHVRLVIDAAAELLDAVHLVLARTGSPAGRFVTTDAELGRA